MAHYFAGRDRVSITLRNSPAQPSVYPLSPLISRIACPGSVARYLIQSPFSCGCVAFAGRSARTPDLTYLIHIKRTSSRFVDLLDSEFPSLSWSALIRASAAGDGLSAAYSVLSTGEAHWGSNRSRQSVFSFYGFKARSVVSQILCQFLRSIPLYRRGADHPRGWASWSRKV